MLILALYYLTVNNQLIAIKYLGVHLLGGNCLSFDIMPIKMAFYAPCNIKCSHSRGVDEIIQLSVKKHIAYQLCFMLQLLFFRNLSNLS